MAPAKQRRALLLAEKVDLIHWVEIGGKKWNVAAAFGIPRSTLSTILKNKSAIAEKAREKSNSENKRIQKPTYGEVEKTLHQWFLHIRAPNLRLRPNATAEGGGFRLHTRSYVLTAGMG